MKRGFGSDNHSGISPEIMEAIASANVDHALAYGDDEYCEKAVQLLRQEFGAQSNVYFVFNGTGANVLNIDAMCRSHHAVVCAETAHINVDECGAPQRIVGCRLLHHSQPRAISITQPTELGTLYTLDEIRALADLAHSHDMYLHMDGARLANAAVALGCTFRQMTTDLGVDCLSFGGTKNGMMIGESAIILNPALDVELKYRRKQMAQLSSKMRFMAAQFEAYLSTGVWRRNAEHSNRMAQMLCQSLREVPQAKVVYPVQANSVFVQLPNKVWNALLDDYFFYLWDEATDVVRWMCSFDTTEEDIHKLVQALKKRLAGLRV